MEANTELQKQQTKHVSQLAELKAQHERELATVTVSLPQSDVGRASPELPPDMFASEALTGSAGAAAIVETAEMEPAQSPTQEVQDILVCARSLGSCELRSLVKGKNGCPVRQS